MKDIYWTIIVIIFLFVIYNCNNYYEKYENTDNTETKKINEQDIKNQTDKWIEEVTVNNNPNNIYNLFCLEGSLLGTVSQEKRKGEDILKYFDYFAHLPNIQVISKKYNISKVTNNVFINTAYIKWMWSGLSEPVEARMSFVFRDKCIFQLHSSKLPEKNEKLLEISNKS